MSSAANSAERIVFFGKGGIGKSTIAANLSVVYARQGRKVLHVGCDPKHDSTWQLLDRPEPSSGAGSAAPPLLETFMEKQLRARELGRSYSWQPEGLVVRGRLGIDCVEAGGPEPGVGCAGRGISMMLEAFRDVRLLEWGKYEICVFDVLGDVVCGGFAAPLRKGIGEKVVIVTSEELMSLYAANNIAKAVRTYADNGVYLAGLVANLRDPRVDRNILELFATTLGTRILTYIPRDPAVRKVELEEGASVVEASPEAPFSVQVGELAKSLLEIGPADCPVPTPMLDREFHARWRGIVAGAGK